MSPALLHTLSQDFIYVLIASGLLWFVSSQARAIERMAYDESQTKLVNALRMWALLGALILLVIAWRLSLPLLVIAIVVAVVINSRKSASEKSTRPEEQPPLRDGLAGPKQ